MFGVTAVHATRLFLIFQYQGSSQSATKPNNPPASTLPDLATQQAAAASKPVAAAASISALKKSSRGGLRSARSFPHDLHGATKPLPTNSAISSTAGRQVSPTYLDRFISRNHHISSIRKL